jgi:uncharacterized RDD family membrane protein YckC
MLLDALVFGPPWPGAHGSLLDNAAEWVTLYPGPSMRGVAFAVIAGTVYHAVFNQRGGRTLGRRVAGTVLVRGSGRPMSWVVVTLRSVMSLVSLAFFGAGYFWAIVDSKGRGWHDLLAGTVVVRRRVRVN